MIKHQRILDALPMLPPEERVDIFTMAYDYLTRHGYHAIGMDHFAQGDDELYKAIGTGTLYRNFMGYTVKRGTDMVGIGVSAIGELGSAYFQNAKEVKEGEEGVDGEGLATYRGCRLTPEDQRRKWVIQSLMCRFEPFRLLPMPRPFQRPSARTSARSSPRSSLSMPMGFSKRTARPSGSRRWEGFSSATSP